MIGTIERRAGTFVAGLVLTAALATADSAAPAAARLDRERLPEVEAPHAAAGFDAAKAFGIGAARALHGSSGLDCFALALERFKGRRGARFEAAELGGRTLFFAAGSGGLACRPYSVGWDE